MRNYWRLIHDPLFWRSLANTLVYAAGTVPTSMGIGLALAIALNRKLPGRIFLRSIYFLPIVVSAVATGTIAAWLFNDNYGAINSILVRLGLPRIAWLSTPQWALPSLIIATLWLRVGFCMIVYMAALQSIPAMYYEAARIDGASALRQFLPYYVAVAAAGDVSVADPERDLLVSRFRPDLRDDRRRPRILHHDAGPVHLSARPSSTSEMGYASAMGVALYAMILLFTVLQWRASRQTENVM